MPWNVAPSSDELAFLMESGCMYRDMRMLREASEVFTGVRALAPKSELPEVALGTISLQQGDFEDANRHYRRALELNPRSAFTHTRLGEVAIFQKDKDAARSHLKKALELDPRGESGRLARNLMEFVDVVQYE
jgi:Tfp pilus assembly protein PilF